MATNKNIEVLGRRNSFNVQKVMWTLGELEVTYKRHDVAGSFGFPDDYLQLNPNKVVPTIRDGDLTLWESNVCVRYLARTYGKGSLWSDDPQTLAHSDQWMDWQGNDIATAFFQVFLNKIRKPASESDAKQIQKGIKGLALWYSVLNDHLSTRSFVAGDQLTMGDIPIGAMSYRFFTLDIDRPKLPHVEQWYQRLCARPAYQKHVMIEYGKDKAGWDAAELANTGIQ